MKGNDYPLFFEDDKRPGAEGIRRNPNNCVN